MNKFKKELSNFKKKEQNNLSPLAYEMSSKTELSDKQIGKNGVLSHEKFRKGENEKFRKGENEKFRKGESDNER